MESRFQDLNLQTLLANRDPRFAEVLRDETENAVAFGRAMELHTLRRKATKTGLIAVPSQTIRIAIVGGASLRPLADFVDHFTSVLSSFQVQVWTGEYDNYLSEILDPDSDLYSFKPQIVVVMPSEARCRYEGSTLDDLDRQATEVDRAATEILDLSRRIRERCQADVILANFRLSPRFDPGPMRNSSLRSDYAFRKAVNTYLGLQAPSFVHICDVEFLANRMGTLQSVDERTWFESKQPYASPLIVAVAKEIAHITQSLTKPAKKLLVLDLDNTIWGGVIGDDGVDGIEIGTTSPRGEAFRDFQIYLKSLSSRGTLLAVSSKNDHERAIEPFLQHPEMVLQLEDIVSFKANWEPKSENISEMATELNLGMDSFVFVDDNIAEIEIVRQFLPNVACIHLGDDPSTFTSKLQDSRYFESRSITSEDVSRSAVYKQEAQRQALKSTVTDMAAYLSSLVMVAAVSNFTAVDAPRISQLINKSNQFNLTTRRRTEAEVNDLIGNLDAEHFTLRLQDRFGTHGLISVVIASQLGSDLSIDTWLMSCRVLKRQVEEETLNEIVRRATKAGCERVLGHYIPTEKNKMVADLYSRLGFSLLSQDHDGIRYSLAVNSYKPFQTYIRIEGCQD